MHYIFRPSQNGDGQIGQHHHRCALPSFLSSLWHWPGAHHKCKALACACPRVAGNAHLHQPGVCCSSNICNSRHRLL